MRESRVLEVKRNILAANDEAAEAFRIERQAEGTFFADVMASPGAGKTTLLLALAADLERKGVDLGGVGVIEADLESDMDALRMKEACVSAVELNTHGACHVEMSMVRRAFAAFGGTTLEWLFLENVGNLVCPADFDTGAHLRLVLLSIPEGWDKVVKYPPIFAAADALVVTKCDYLPLNPDFDLDALKERARVLNPSLEVFVTSARTGEGIGGLAAWLMGRRGALLAEASSAKAAEGKAPAPYPAGGSPEIFE